MSCRFLPTSRSKKERERKIKTTHRVPALSPDLALAHFQIPSHDQHHFWVASERVSVGNRCCCLCCCCCCRCCRVLLAVLLSCSLRRRRRQRLCQFRESLFERDKGVRQSLLVGQLRERSGDAAVREQPQGQAVARGGSYGRAGGEGCHGGGIGCRRRRHSIRVCERPWMLPFLCFQFVRWRAIEHEERRARARRSRGNERGRGARVKSRKSVSL